MNEIVNKFLLAGDAFMPEMHLKQPGFTYSACGSFTKNKERIQKFKEAGYTSYIYKNELDKACFQHDRLMEILKIQQKKTTFDKFLRDKAFNIAKNPKYDGYQRELAFMINKCFDKNPKGSGINMEAKPVRRAYANNEKLAEELHKPIIRKFKKGRFIQDLKTIFGVLIQLICN